MHALRFAKPVTTVQASAAVCSFARFHISQAHSAHPADARVNTARMTATIVVAKVRNPMPRSLAEVGPSSRRQQGKFLDTTSGAHAATTGEAGPWVGNFPDNRRGTPSPPAAPRPRAAWRARLPGQSRSRGDSLYDLIRPQQQRRRDREAEGLGGLEVDDELALAIVAYRGAETSYLRFDRRLFVTRRLRFCRMTVWRNARSVRCQPVGIDDFFPNGVIVATSSTLSIRFLIFGGGETMRPFTMIRMSDAYPSPWISSAWAFAS